MDNFTSPTEITFVAMFNKKAVKIVSYSIMIIYNLKMIIIVNDYL